MSANVTGAMDPHAAAAPRGRVYRPQAVPAVYGSGDNVACVVYVQMPYLLSDAPKGTFNVNGRHAWDDAKAAALDLSAWLRVEGQAPDLYVLG